MSGTVRGGAGFALVSALFLIVVLGLLTAVAVRIGTAQQQTVSSALSEARALAAAEAGIDWGAYLAVTNAACSGSTTLSLSEAALKGYTVTVTCTATSFTEGGSAYASYTIAASASFGTYGAPDFVQRVVRATFTSAT
jgi:MSHA biogenesis protein MshP